MDNLSIKARKLSFTDTNSDHSVLPRDELKSESIGEPALLIESLVTEVIVESVMQPQPTVNQSLTTNDQTQSHVNQSESLVETLDSQLIELDEKQPVAHPLEKESIITKSPPSQVDIASITDRLETPLITEPLNINTGSLTAPQLPQRPSSENEYRLKAITFTLPNQTETHIKILCQIQNGPCPLIALCNVLVLRNSIGFEYDLNSLTFIQIQQTLVDYFLTLEKEMDLDVLLELLANAQFGLNLNVLFDGSVEIQKVEQDLFKVFGVEVVHGWSIDPQDEELYRVGVSLVNGYNGAMLLMVQQQELNAKLVRSAEEEQTCHDATVIDTFLKDSTGQMTIYGLVCLLERIKEKQVCVLFRNNHFLVLVKSNGLLYTLVTDQGYESNSEIVWESLDNCDGDSQFMTSEFKVFEKERVMSAQDPLTPDQDEILAKSLQIEQEYQEKQRLDKQRLKASNSNLSSKSKKNGKKDCMVM